MRIKPVRNLDYGDSVSGARETADGRAEGTDGARPVSGTK
jgi:hypothetical protein